jgi:anti-repressor protein
MGKDLRVFSFEGKQTRVILIDGEPWWVAKDVCDILELTNPTETLKALDDDEKGSLRISEGTSPKGGNPNVNVINESGVYTLIMRSNKPEAKKFRKWVTSEVLPSIRKHGVYMMPQKIEEVLNDPDTIISLAQALKQERAKAKALETKIEKDRSMMLFAEALIASRTLVTFGTFAKTLRQHGYKTGLKRIFKQLHGESYLMKDRNTRRYIPTQKAMELGLFEFTTKIVNDGTIHTSTSIRLTVKGQIYFINKFLGHPLNSALENTNQLTLPGIEVGNTPVSA